MTKHDAQNMQDSNTEAPILIRAASKRNGMTSVFVGAVALLVAIAMFKLLPEDTHIIAIFMTSLAIVAFLIGWFKVREPAHSLMLDKQHIHYLHRKGHWQLSWNNIQRVDIPRVTNGIDQTELMLIGLRIKHYQPLLQAISPRLATHIMMEQRPLLLQSQSENCQSGSCYSDDLIEEDRFKDEDGTVYTGVKAMFANRMNKLRQRLGYDLFINASELDREVNEFVSLLRDCHRTAIDHEVLDSIQ